VQIFAGKDGSRGLGMSSLKPEDAVADYSTLDEKEMGVLDVRSQPLNTVTRLILQHWHSYYSKRYNVVGKVQADGETLKDAEAPKL
jgi:membrane-associated progesterone receptor component